MSKAKTQLASEKALEFCVNNPGWQRICDITPEVYDTLYEKWEDLSQYRKDLWNSKYGRNDGQSAWEEFADKKCKVHYAFIDCDGNFSDELPAVYNHMMIFKTT